MEPYTQRGIVDHCISMNSGSVIGKLIINAMVKSQHKVDCIVFSSSNAVYGNGQVQQEETVPQPEDPYGISKYSTETELDLKSAHKMWGMESVILRLHNVYGPNQNMKERDGNAIGRFMNQPSMCDGTHPQQVGGGEFGTVPRRILSQVHDSLHEGACEEDGRALQQRSKSQGLC